MQNVNDVPSIEVDLKTHPTAQKLVDSCRQFFTEVEDLSVAQIRFHFPRPDTS